jgi:hypothetical protein
MGREVIDAATLFQNLAAQLKSAKGESILVLLSNWLCNEDLEAVKNFVSMYLPKATMSGPALKEGGDSILRRWDFGPNAYGLRDIIKPFFKETKDLQKSYSLILSFGVDPASLGISRTEKFFYHGAYEEAFITEAALTAPALVHGEIDGSYTNFEGVVQNFKPFLKAAATSISAEEFIHNLANKMEAK